MEVIGIVAVALLIIVGGMILNGFVLSKLWLWFVVPVFHLPVLTIPVAIGIGLIVSFLVQFPTIPDPEEHKESAEVVGGLFGKYILGPLFILFIAWTITLFL